MMNDPMVCCTEGELVTMAREARRVTRDALVAELRVLVELKGNVMIVSSADFSVTGRIAAAASALEVLEGQ